MSDSREELYPMLAVLAGVMGCVSLEQRWGLVGNYIGGRIPVTYVRATDYSLPVGLVSPAIKETNSRF